MFPDLSEEPGWNVYLDDTTILEKLEESMAEELAGSTPDEQKQIRAAYSWWGIPTNSAKSLERCRDAERLGSVIDGRAGILKTRSKRSLDLVGLGSWIRSTSSSSGGVFTQ